MATNDQGFFYLKNANTNQYLIAADKGKYNWPLLGNRSNAVKLKLTQTKDAKGKVVWKITSTEPGLGEKTVLGAFTDSRDCYYWSDNYDPRKQGWEFLSTSGGTDASPSGDILIRNTSYQQYLVADPKYKGYITTDKEMRNVWSLVPVDGAAERTRAQMEKVFQLSVASGDPTDNSVIIWTRLNDNKNSITYEVSTTKDFKNIVQSGTVEPSQFGADKDYTVHVDVKELAPNQTHFYRFTYQGVTSQIGRCRTLPAADADMRRLRLAVITCNDYSSGYFNAFYKLADADIDFVVHLGDFVYEYSQYPDGYGTRHREEISFADKTYQISKGEEGYEGCERAFDLNDFRSTYRTYRRDKGLQAAMENHTWLIMLDDHEIADDFYWDYARNTAGANSDHPIYRIAEDSAAEMMTLCRNGKQAWREYVPYRPIIDERFPEDHPNHYRLYRGFKFGQLMEFFLSDSRSYRDRPELDINKAIEKVLHDAIEEDADAPFMDILKRERKKRLPNDKKSEKEGGPYDWRLSMLGPEQKKWLKQGIADSKSKWRVWGNQTLLATATLQNVTYKKMYDDWHGFRVERYEILHAIKESERQRSGNNASYFVVLTGDMHTSMISYLKTDFEGARSALNLDYDRLVGVEFMTPAVTSPGLAEGAKAAGGLASSAVGKLSESLVDVIAQGMKATNPHIEDVDSTVNGYAIATFTPTEMTWEVFGVDKTAYEEVEQPTANGPVKQKVSTSGAEAKRVRSVRYDPSKLNLDQWKS